MDRIFSARLSEAVLDELDRVVSREGTTKKRFLEEAIRLRAVQALDRGDDVWSETLGAWRRTESPSASVARARRAFRATFERHHRARRAGVRR